jgi:iron(III) transport system permease protein
VSISATVQRASRQFRVPALPAVLAMVVVGTLVVLPLGAVLMDAFNPQGLEAWRELSTGPLNETLLTRPLLATLSVGLVGAVLATSIGAFLAVAVTVTDMPGRRTAAALAMVPLMLPGFASAFAWSTVFGNDRLGANIGLLAAMGFDVPDWVAWGLLPTAAVLGSHYYAMVFGLTAAALLQIDGGTIDAARTTGASVARIAGKVIVPMVRTAVIGGFMLAFAACASNFAIPAILGLPVNFQTLSTRLFGLLETGQNSRALVLAIVLLAAAAATVAAAERVRGQSSASRVIARPAFLPLGRRLLFCSPPASPTIQPRPFKPLISTPGLGPMESCEMTIYGRRS